MRTYDNHFSYYANGGRLLADKDVFFHMFMKFCSSIMPSKGFFFTCILLYVYPMYKVSKTFFKDYWFYSVLLLIVSYSFYTYGVNGIRNGIATSLFLWGLCYQNSKIKMALFFILAVMFHKTLLLPIMAYVITFFIKSPKLYLRFWLLAIPLSLALGGFWESLFSSLGFADDRLEAYLASSDEVSGSFRFDFLFYSSFAVFAGWYFIFKKNFNDPLYFRLFGTYLICNAFWILVIRASFSNRFSYLSWFMMGLVIVYPFLKERFFKNHHLILGSVILLYFLFTYLLFYIYYANKEFFNT
jgi:hypothetical protein